MQQTNKNPDYYMLKASEAFRKKIMIISPEFKILSAGGKDFDKHEPDVVGTLCYEALYGRNSPCNNCPALEVAQTHTLALREPQGGFSCLYSYPVFSGEKIEAFAMFDFEFSDIKELGEKLHSRSNAFLRNLILSAVDGVVSADRSGKIRMFNDAAAEITGFSVDEAINKLDIWDIYIDDGAREIMKKLRSDEYGGKGKLKAYHVNILRKDGATVPISLNASIVYEDDREAATIGFFHDLRVELKMKKELAHTQSQLLQSEKMASLGKLAAGVAHQLNNPLAGIIIFSKLIMEEYDLVEEAKEDLRRVILDAERCRDTVKELLEFSRQTSQLMRPHDVNKAITRTLFLLENQTLFHNIEIEKNLDPMLPSVNANMQQLNHVFLNLILNAADAMDGRGKLTINAYRISGKNGVCIEISDTGPGIPEKKQKQIFEPFFTTKEEGKGTGLGLSMVYGIVEDHGGIIYVKNKPDQGATFYIELPIVARDNQGDDNGK